MEEVYNQSQLGEEKNTLLQLIGGKTTFFPLFLLNEVG